MIVATTTLRVTSRNNLVANRSSQSFLILVNDQQDHNRTITSAAVSSGDEGDVTNNRKMNQQQKSWNRMKELNLLNRTMFMKVIIMILYCSYYHPSSTSSYYTCHAYDTDTWYRNNARVRDMGDDQSEFDIPTFRVYIALFGNISPYITRLNIMYPPLLSMQQQEAVSNSTSVLGDDDDDAGHYLCTVPSSIQRRIELQNSNSEEYNGEANIPHSNTGLLVKYGGNCTVQQKADVLLQIHQLARGIRYLLIYDSIEPMKDRKNYNDDAVFLDNSTGNHETDSTNTDIDPNTDDNKMMRPTSFFLEPDRYPVSSIYDEIVILYIKYYDAQRIKTEMDNLVALIDSTGNDRSSNISLRSNYLDVTPSTTNVLWNFYFYITGLPSDANGPSSDSNSNNNGNNEYEEPPMNFFWIRLALFGLLLMAPCIRAMYLFYAGGGRILFRRHPDTGRINGLQYIPPVASWLAIGVPLQHLQQNQQNVIRRMMTEEEFNRLPEIKYQHSETLSSATIKEKSKEQEPSRLPSSRNGLVDDNDDNDDDDVNKPSIAFNTSFDSAAEKGLMGDIFIDNDDNGDGNIDDDRKEAATKNIDQNMQPAVKESTEKINTINTINKIQSIPVPTSSAQSSNSSDIGNSTMATTPEITTSEDPMTTTCTTCSICIEDFIPGETLTFLPKCKHAFHKTCIRPWLLERQGCCPLCKTAVLDDEENSVNETNQDVPVESASNNNSNNNNSSDTNREESGRRNRILQQRSLRSRVVRDINTSN